MFAQRGGFAGARGGGFRPFGGGGFRRRRWHGGGFRGPAFYPTPYPIYGYPWPLAYPGFWPWRRKKKAPPGEWEEEDDILLDALKEKRRDLIAQEYGLDGGASGIDEVGLFENVRRRFAEGQQYRVGTKQGVFAKSRSTASKAASPAYWFRRAGQALTGRFSEKSIRKHLRKRQRRIDDRLHRLSGVPDGAGPHDTVRGLGEYQMESAEVGDRITLVPTGTPFVLVRGGDPALRPPFVVTDDTQFQNPPPFQRRDIPRYVGWQTPSIRLRRGIDVQWPL